jgi:hypothetical protein
MPYIVAFDKDNNCKIAKDNCASFDVTLERNDIIGLIEHEYDSNIPMDDLFISSVIETITNKLPK